MKRRGEAPLPALLVAALFALVTALAACGPPGPSFRLLASCDFETGRAEEWRPNFPDRWRVASEGGSMVYELTAPGDPGPVRAPTSWSVWSGHEVTSFEFTGRLRCSTDPSIKVRDMCVIFHFRDAAHFNYVHFAASSDGVHNIIGLVDGADRIKVNDEPAGESTCRLTDRDWHAFKVAYDERTGVVRAYLDDMSSPILTSRGRALGRGFVGVGSFDDTGAFDDLVLRGPK